MRARAELMQLVRAARAWVDWVHHSGVDHLPAQTSTTELLDDLTARRSGLAGRPPERNQQPPKRNQPSVRSPQPVAGTRSHAATPAAAAQAPDRRHRNADAKRKRLAQMAEEVSTCTKCRLHESRDKAAFSRGSSDSEIAFVGEGPGAEEDRLGLPFVGRAGELLDKMVAGMGYGRDDVYIANVVKCRPPDNRKPEADEIEACAPYLREQLELVDPKVVVALGATGVQGLLGTRMGITRMRGTWKLYRGRVPLMPTFHPAYLLRSPEKKRDVWNDLKQVMRKLGRTPPQKRKG